jgi:hypothetical protein
VREHNRYLRFGHWDVHPYWNSLWSAFTISISVTLSIVFTVSIATRSSEQFVSDR